MKRIRIIKTKFDDLYRIKRKPIHDVRGFFLRLIDQEIFNYFKFNDIKTQINFSFNKKKGIIRGMHFQIPPYDEKKLVTCVQGSIYDVVIDLRKNSKTYLKYYSEVLSAKEFNSLLIPEGFAHGFQTLEDNTQLFYIHSNLYNKSYERGINVLDPMFKIKWPLKEKIISEKDKNIEFLNTTFKGFKI